MEKVDFLATDGVELMGLLYKSKVKSNSVIIMVHGMTSNCFKKRNDIFAKEATDNEIDYFCFNNRGAEIIRPIKKVVNGKRKKFLCGMAYEDVLESHYDVIGSIKKMKELGYENIYLLGHSLGCTKIIYTYNKLIEENNIEILSSINSLILLSLVDIPSVLKVFLKDKKETYLKLAEEKVKNGQEYDLMPRESFIHPISCKSFIQYARDYHKFDFINTIEDEKLEVLNNITIPIFMRWGNVQEMILQEAEQYSSKIRSLIKNDKTDINYIDGADHSYHGKEEIVAKQFINFIKKY